MSRSILDRTALRRSKQPGSLHGMQERRRKRMREMQATRRRDMVERVRQMARSAGQEGGGASQPAIQPDQAPAAGAAAAGAGTAAEHPAAQGAADAAAKEQVARRRQAFHKQLAQRREWAMSMAHPEWMTEVPGDLFVQGREEGWYLMPRPEGTPCLIVSSHGRTVARSKQGTVLKRFRSWLPDGSPRTAVARDGYSLFEGVYCSAAKTFFLTDCVCWKGHVMYDCSAHFRLSWLATKMREDAEGADTRRPDAGNDYAMQALPFIPCTRASLHAAVAGSYPFPLDGLYFVSKGAAHEAGPTPFVLIWKDASTSSFLFDGTRAGHTGPLPPLCVTLRGDADGMMRTLDGTAPEGLGAVMAQASAAAQRSGRDLFTVAVSAVHVEAGGEGRVAVEGAQYRRQPSPAKSLPDPLSKLLFQHLLRTTPLTLDRLLAEGGPEGPAPAVAAAAGAAAVPHGGVEEEEED